MQGDLGSLQLTEPGGSRDMEEEGNGNQEEGLREFWNEGIEGGMGRTGGVLSASDGLAGGGPQEATVVPKEASDWEGWGMDVDADLLVEIFSYLPQKDLFEVMLVSRHWGKAVREADILWKKVEVVRNWDIGAVRVEGMGVRGRKILNRVLSVAQDVIFLRPFDDDTDHMMSAGVVLGPKLRTLELPKHSIDTAFLTALESNLPHLESLKIKGDLAYEGEVAHIHIRHSKLETLAFVCQTTQPLTISCPNLANLSINGGRTGAYPALYFFDCPRLKNLCLSARYSTPEMLKSIAQCAPHISRVEIGCDNGRPYDALTHFGSLKHLVLQEVIGNISFLAAELAHLETLVVDGQHCAHSLEVRLRNLRVLIVLDMYGFMSPTLDCLSLEALSVRSSEFSIEFLENLNSSCPLLMKVEIERLRCSGRADRLLGPLELFHETLMELKLVNLQYAPIRLKCLNLSKLTMEWVGSEAKELRLEMDCPNLNALHLSGYDVEDCLPSILSTVPTLKSVCVSNAS